MILLAIETATDELGVALVDGSGPIAEATEHSGRHHVERLHPMIASLLEKAGSEERIGALAVDVGPGLFTGLRVGMAAAMGFALGLGVPVVACTSTEILLAACADDERSVVPVVDVRRGEVAYELPGAPGQIHLGTPARLAEALAPLEGPLRLIGDGASRYAEALRAVLPEADLLIDGPSAPPVATLARTGRARALAGESVSPERLEPRYLRDADAKANFATRPTAPAG